MKVIIVGAGAIGAHLADLFSKIKQDIVISGVTKQITSGDTVNYITFFISLTTICFAIYRGRLNEARKAYREGEADEE